MNRSLFLVLILLFPCVIKAQRDSLVIESVFIIRSDTTVHMAFPAIEKLSDGSYLLVYRQGNAHVDTSGKIVYQTCSSDFNNWSAPAVLIDNSGIDDRDPSISILPDGNVLLNYFMYARGKRGVAPTNIHIHSAIVSVSDMTVINSVQVDPGHLHYDSPAMKNDIWVDESGEPIIGYGCSDAALILNDRWIIPSYGGHPLAFVNEKVISPASRIVLWESIDKGCSPSIRNS